MIIKSLLIGGVIYNLRKIKKTSQALNMQTDRSALYEKVLNVYLFVKSVKDVKPKFGS